MEPNEEVLKPIFNRRLGWGRKRPAPITCVNPCMEHNIGRKVNKRGFPFLSLFIIYRVVLLLFDYSYRIQLSGLYSVNDHFSSFLSSILNSECLYKAIDCGQQD